jgi:hypothetical protein
MSNPLLPIGQMNLQPAAPNWLWPSYLAAGKLTLLDGDPGCGKSLITMDLAARLSRAAAMPDGAIPHAPCKTLILNAEDDRADTILPRLKAAGADTDFVFVHDAGDRPQLPHDLPKIEELIRDCGIGLVVIDPLTGFVPPNLADGGLIAVRRALAPLALLAARTGVAVLLVRHLTKREGGRALYRGLGSMSIAGLARTALLVGRHPRDSKRGLLAVTKTNLTVTPDPLAFRLQPRDDSVVVDWLGPVAGIADDACRRPERADLPGVVRATLWLIDALAEGPRHAAELLAAAKADGINERTLNSAKKSLKVPSKFTNIPGERRAWLWCPPPKPFESSLEPLEFELEPLEDPLMKDLPKNMSEKTKKILTHDRLDWVSKNLKRRK